MLVGLDQSAAPTAIRVDRSAIFVNIKIISDVIPQLPSSTALADHFRKGGEEFLAC